jgi:hypothetical protein
VNTENLLSLIGEIDERYISEAAPQNSGEIVMTATVKKRVGVFSKAFQLVACFAIIVAAVLLIQNRDEFINKPDDSGTITSFVTETIPAATTVTAAPEMAVSTIEETSVDIKINEIFEYPWTGKSVALRHELFTDMDKAELENYYGMSAAPRYLPDDITGENVYDNTTSKGIYYFPDGTINYDVNTFLYIESSKLDEYNEDHYFIPGTRGVYIQIFKEFANVFTAGDTVLEKSKIGLTEAIITVLRTETDDIYYANFDINDVHFIITGMNVTKDEFIEIVSSYTVDDKRMNKIKIHKILGEPDGLLSGFDGEIFVTETGKRIYFYYDASQYVTAVRIRDEDDTLIWEAD